MLEQCYFRSLSGLGTMIIILAILLNLKHILLMNLL